MEREIDIAPLLQGLLHKQITVVCPKALSARVLENRILNSLDNLETGIKGTQHPALPQVYEGPYDLIIVPGLAFDHQKYRLGYGGGYYDGFLTTQPQAHKVGIFYPFQQADEVPREAHDVCLDEILLGRF
jgi:5-formyltetrahydrofolate cyclo-ligase